MVDARSPAWREQWDLDGTLEYILSRGYQRITLQFPDELLEHATVVAAELQTACAQRWQLVQVYVLADTSYNSLSVDEVAAQHAAADCVVHYGRASLSPLSRLPAYFVFGRQQLDVASVVSRICDYAKQLDGSGAQKAVLVLPDQPYTHVCAELRRLLGQAGLAVPVVVADVAARQLEPVNAQPSRGSDPSSCKQSACCSTSSTTGSVAVSGAAEPAQQQAAMPACCSTNKTPATVAASDRAASSSSDRGAPEPGQPQVAVARLGATCPSGTAAASEGVPVAQDVGQDQPAHCSEASLAGAAVRATPCKCAPHADHGPCHATGANSVSATDAPGQWPAFAETAAQDCAAAEASRQSAASASDQSEALRSSVAGLVWELPAGLQLEDCAMLWLGPDDAPALLLLQLTYNSCHWIMFDPAAQCWQEGLPTEISRTLRKRYYLVEKAKNANIVGILVGTLGVAGYLQAVERLRALAQAAGKKTYTLLMGKPNPAKLANFPEVEVFVMVADPQGMILDSKDFYAPIITPFEAELAWGAQQREWTGAYRLDFNQLLEEQPQAAGQPASGPRFSLLSGGYHADDATSGTEGLTEHVAALAVRDPGGLQLSTGSAGGALVEVKSAAEYLAKRRSYTGLEAPMVGAPAKAVEKAVAGRSGRAAHYDDEPA